MIRCAGDQTSFHDFIWRQQNTSFPLPSRVDNALACCFPSMAVNEVSMKGGECDPLTRSPCLGRDKARRFVAASSLVKRRWRFLSWKVEEISRHRSAHSSNKRLHRLINGSTIDFSKNKSFEKSLFTRFPWNFTTIPFSNIFFNSQL